MWGKNRICLENRKYVGTLFVGRQGCNDVGMYVGVLRMKLKGVMWNSPGRSYDIRWDNV